MTNMINATILASAIQSINYSGDTDMVGDIMNILNIAADDDGMPPKVSNATIPVVTMDQIHDLLTLMSDPYHQDAVSIPSDSMITAIMTATTVVV